MPTRLKFIVAYDGRPFAGWQSQANGNTVQDRLEHAFLSVRGEQTRVHGAGRTDAGVHALAQCAHIDLPGRTLRPEVWLSALNASLPPTIRVLRCAYVTTAFHARFSAQGKVYRYRIWNDRVLPPLEHGRAWLVTAPLDFALMKVEAQDFIGRHNFASFAANRGKLGEDTARTISAVKVQRVGKCITFEFSGDGFLYKMVRLMVGALILAGRGKEMRGSVRARLAEPTRSASGARTAAPAEGLFLIRVRY